MQQVCNKKFISYSSFNCDDNVACVMMDQLQSTSSFTSCLDRFAWWVDDWDSSDLSDCLVLLCEQGCWGCLGWRDDLFAACPFRLNYTEKLYFFEDEILKKN